MAIAGATAYGYLWSAGHARSTAKKEMTLEAKRAAALIASSTAAAKQSVAQLTAQPGLEKAFTPAGAKNCQLSVEGSEAFPSLRLDIVTAGGRVGCSSQPSPAVLAPAVHRGSPWLARALRAKGPIVVWDATDAATHQSAVAVAAPLIAGGKAVGAVVAFQHVPQAAAALATNVGGSDHPSFTVVETANRSLVSASERAQGRTDIGGFRDLKAQGEWAGIDGSQRLFGSATVPGSGWRVYAGVRRSAVLAEAHGALTRQVLIGVVALLVLIAGGWILNRRVAGPLRGLSRAVMRAGRKEDDARVEEAGTAELVSLARQFNAMLDLREGHEAELGYQATHDALTGLPNATLFRERLDEVLVPGNLGAGVAVICLRVDRLDVVNEGFGRGTGDRVLAEVATRLSTALRPGDTLARSGDEFLILCLDAAEQSALNAAMRFHACLSEPFRGPVSDIVLHATVGVTRAHGSGSADQLLREADSAMREAARKGHEMHRFDPEAHFRATEHLEAENALRTALQEDQLRVYYQPLVEVPSGRIVGCEALVRWRHPERGLVLPAEFLPIAEDTRQIEAIDRWVLTRACEQAADWAAAGHPLRISVNVAAGQLGTDAFERFVGEVLRETGLAPEQLCFEITESSLMRKAARESEHLYGLKRLGVVLSIDDFGTGYSSLSYLHQLPVDEIKIDRSFIKRLGPGRRDRHLVEAIVGMARALDLEVVAEGVESEQQLKVLAGLECERAQGYLFGRPQPADQILPLVIESEQQDEPLEAVMGSRTRVVTKT
ncbi:MAG TPA: EAL domain-containing protein [Thermoleophilaceae bacterium]